MNPRVLSGPAAWLSFLSFFSISMACGPFFPDTLLDKPRASLGAPAVSYLAELCRVSGVETPAHGLPSTPPLIAQIIPEQDELRKEWTAAGVPEATIAARLQHYEEVRTALLADVVDTGRMGFQSDVGAAGNLPPRPLGGDFPQDVADYVEAARLHATGDTAAARSLWSAILARPAGERRLRGTWAAWMMAKTSPALPECLKWYEQVEKEAAAGGADILGLAMAAKSWRAPVIEDRVEGIRLFHDAFKGGRIAAAADLRELSRKVLSEANPAVLSKAAADPVVRKLLNLELQATFDGVFQNGELEEAAYAEALGTETPDEDADADASDEPVAPQPEMLTDAWLKALEARADLPLDEGARLAWALYSKGRHAEARRWLDLSTQDDPLSHWLHAKFALRAGQLDEANRRLTQAVRILSARGDWNPGNPHLDQHWGDGYERLRSSTQGRLLADEGLVALARQEYPKALESLRRGGYEEDAAYLAERVLSTDELLTHTRAVAPAWTSLAEQPADASREGEADEEEDESAWADSPAVDPATCTGGVTGFQWHETVDNRLRYQLARRLAREGRLKDAEEFMPPSITGLFRHYRLLDEARASGKYEGETLAAITWRQALIHRLWGAELFSTDCAPDGGARGWSFEVPDLARLRSHPEGWSVRLVDYLEVVSPATRDEDRAVPLVAGDEIQRVRNHPLPNPNRYHYRYTAADLAWKAAESLPDNHPKLADLCNTAGRWLAGRDPKAANRFYRAIVKRCGETEAGKAAEQKHWFPPGLEPLVDLAALPEELQPAPAAP